MNPKIYKQLDSRWSSLPYPTKASSFGGNGCGCCACVHIAIEQESKKKWTPATLRPWMVKQGYAYPNQGTTWNGITETLKHLGHKKVVRIWDDPMSEAWKELNKGNRIGVLLVDNSRTPDGTYWTSSGHYVAFTDYKLKNGKHWFYIKDSGARGHDGWFCYEKSIKGALPKLWIVERLDAPKPTPSVKIKGIDISAWQGKISVDGFKKAKADGIKFVILRVGFTGVESRKPTLDSCFENNYKHAKAAGLKIGYYYYTTATNKTMAKKEAEFTLKNIKGKQCDYPVYFDIEDPVHQDKLSSKKLAKLCDAFCNTIKKAGYKPGVYASLNWFNNKIGNITAPHTKWVAQYYKKCEYKGAYDMWQYSSSGKVDGLSGNIDMNYCYKKWGDK